MALLDGVKVALRVKSTAFDVTEIQPIIDACKTDLKLSGLNVIEDTDPLLQRAVILYAKGMFGYDTNSERYMQAYTMLKNSMALSGDYNSYKITFTVTSASLPVKGAIITTDTESIVTNSLGVAEFNVTEKADYDYTVTIEGVAAVSSYAYVDKSTAVSVVI